MLTLGLLVVLTACTSLSLPYNNGDTLLYWWLNSYVGLEDDQKGLAKREIDALFKWHRKTQLEDYAQLLVSAQKQLQGNVTQADLLQTYEGARGRMEVLLLKTGPDLATLARTLKPAQIAKMEKKFASTNDDFRRKYLRGDQEKRQKVRYKKAMEQFELWFGSFSREQEDKIRKLSDARPLDNDVWLDERVMRQKKILAMLYKVHNEKLGQEATVALINDLIKDGFVRRAPSPRRDFLDAYNDATANMVIGVLRMATPAQKAHAQKRMQDWVNELNTMAAEAK